jgi:hypothetical protein
VRGFDHRLAAARGGLDRAVVGDIARIERQPLVRPVAEGECLYRRDDPRVPAGEFDAEVAEQIAPLDVRLAREGDGERQFMVARGE